VISPTRLPALAAALLCALSLALLGTGCASTERASIPAGPWKPIGTSVENRPLVARVLGRGADCVYLVGGIHGDERDGGRHLDELCTALVGPGSPLAGLRLRVLRDMNPDGSRAGMRTNANEIDLNRNWPASNFEPGEGRGPFALSEPETEAAHEDIVLHAPTLVLVLHASQRGPFVNFDGPAAELADAFADAAARVDPRWRVVADMGYPTPGSFGTWGGADRGLPVLTVEFERGHNEDLARRSLVAGVTAVLREAARRPLP
jgi:protein MpaA